MKHNDLDLKNWKELDINVDSLWLIKERDKGGKHSNFYHGNFIPQIPYQLIKRYTKQGETVLDVFLGSGTTLFEAEKLNRNFIGFDINDEMIDYVQNQMNTDSSSINFSIKKCDVTNSNFFDTQIHQATLELAIKKVHFAILHPPYMDIVKFTDKKEDLSQISDEILFTEKFIGVIQNVFNWLEKDRYFGIVIGDVYKNGEVIPLASNIISAVKQNFDVKLKGVVIKNIEGNRGKQGKGGIWKYRALNSDYFIFKHEYILVFKKNK